MQWFVAAKNSHVDHFLLGGLFTMLIAVSAAPTTFAVDTEIGVSVCGQVAPSSAIDITQPNNDSVVDQAVTTFRGTVSNAVQIEIEVDGGYSGTIAIGANQGSFNTDITLDKGTHTIQMTATNVCGGADASDSVVITYQPTAAPSTGITTPTEVANESTAEPVDTSESAGSVFDQIAQVPVIGPVVSMVGDLARTIGLETTITGNNTPVIAGVTRVVVTVAALTSVVMATSLAPLVVQSVPGVSKFFTASSSRSMLYLGWVIRGAGILLFSLVYFL